MSLLQTQWLFRLIVGNVILVIKFCVKVYFLVLTAITWLCTFVVSCSKNHIKTIVADKNEYAKESKGHSCLAFASRYCASYTGKGQMSLSTVSFCIDHVLGIIKTVGSMIFTTRSHDKLFYVTESCCFGQARKKDKHPMRLKTCLYVVAQISWRNLNVILPGLVETKRDFCIRPCHSCLWPLVLSHCPCHLSCCSYQWTASSNLSNLFTIHHK